MPLCYYKEAFVLGLVSALLILITIHLFEDVIENWVESIRGIFKIA